MPVHNGSMKHNVGGGGTRTFIGGQPAEAKHPASAFYLSDPMGEDFNYAEAFKAST